MINGILSLYGDEVQRGDARNDSYSFTGYCALSRGYPQIDSSLGFQERSPACFAPILCPDLGAVQED